MKKLIIFICSLAVILVSVIVPVSAEQNYYANIEGLSCKSDLLMSLDNNEIIVSNNADVPVAPASLTKLMTALVVLKNCPDLEQMMTVSQEAIATLAGTGSSLSGLKAGEQISLYNMLCCMMIPSGNDAAVALAAQVGGSIENFVAMMNQTAAELGCKNTHFVNPHGLDAEGHQSTASDLALIAKKDLEYSVFKKIVSLVEYELPQTNMNPARKIVNTNFLINPGYTTYYYSPCKGIKTGSTDLAGKCLVSYASKDGYNYLAVALGGEYKDTDGDKVEENQAFMDSIRMFKWAFANMSYEQVAKQNQFVADIPLNYCWKTDAMRLVAKNEAFALIPKGNDSESVEFEPVEKPESIDAPVKAGDSVCSAKILYAGQQIGTVELIAAEDANMSVLLYAKAVLKRITGYTVFKIIVVVILLFAVLYVIMYIRANRKRRKSRELKIVKYNELERNTAKKNKNSKKK